MNIKEMLTCYIDHRRDVVYRRTAFRLRRAEARAHILEGYKLALDNLDDCVQETIKAIGVLPSNQTIDIDLGHAGCMAPLRLIQEGEG